MKTGILSVLVSAVFPATETVPGIEQILKNNFRMVKWWNNPWSLYLVIYHIPLGTQIKHHDENYLELMSLLLSEVLYKRKVFDFMTMQLGNFCCETLLSHSLHAHQGK